jgi:hypothetical protein
MAIGAGAGLRAVTTAPENPAVIVNSGSTNAPGFRIVVAKSGDAEYTVVPRRGRAQTHSGELKPIHLTIPDALVQRFYSDLEAARPLSALSQGRCVKSVSFGTILTIESGDERTPDLSCPGNQDVRMQNLERDANDIVKLFPAIKPGAPAL